MDKYEKVKGGDGFLGQGNFGVVEKYIRKSDRQVLACKIIRFRHDERHRAPVLHEYDILSKLKHPNIVAYVDIVWEPSAAQIFMSYCEGGSLADFIESRAESRSSLVSEQYICSVFSQLASALLYCHTGIIIQSDGSTSGSFWNWDPILHRDIKPGNIMLSSKAELVSVIAMLGDFGLSTFVTLEKAPSTYAGTKQYLAPEISRSSQAGNHWTKMCDIFSLGCSIWELGSLKAPYSWHVDNDDEYRDLPEMYSVHLNRLLAACMSIIPDRRPDASDLLRSLRRYQQRMGFLIELQDVSASHPIPPSAASPNVEVPPIKLNIKTLTGKISTLYAYRSTLIAEVKEQIYAQDGIAPDSQRLVYGGLKLEDEHTVESYDIQNESTVYLIVRVSLKSAPQTNSEQSRKEGDRGKEKGIFRRLFGRDDKEYI